MLTLRGARCARRDSALRDLSIIEDGSILIRDGRIVMVGPTRRIQNLKEARSATHLSVEDMVVMPGLIDPGLRLALLPDSHSAALRRRPKKISELLFDTGKLMRCCADQGTLTAQLKANTGTGALRSDHSLLRQLAELKASPVRLVRSWRVDSQAASREPDYDYHEGLYSLSHKNLVQSIALHSRPGSSFGSWADRLWAAAGENGLAVSLSWPGGPASVLSDALRRAAPRTVYTPSTLSPDECDVLAASPAVVVFSPNRDLAQARFGDSVRRIVDRGGAVALATGYDCWHSQNFSMQLAWSLGVVQLGLSAEEAISASTINAAYAIGAGDFTGSLEDGKNADLLVMNVQDYRELPSYLGLNKVLWAMREGKIVFDNRAISKARAS